MFNYNSLQNSSEVKASQAKDIFRSLQVYIFHVLFPLLETFIYLWNLKVLGSCERNVWCSLKSRSGRDVSMLNSRRVIEYTHSWVAVAYFVSLIVHSFFNKYRVPEYILFFLGPGNIALNKKKVLALVMLTSCMGRSK